jgi:DNA-binding SARP family transcriptional activator
MRFGLLGPVTVQLDTVSAPVRVEQRMPEILLAALLLNAGKTVPTVKLTTALWGYDPPPSAASSLYNHVGRLRRLLGSEGGGRIRTASVGYVIDAGPDELDAAEFAALCAEATRMREAGDWAGASESFTAALSLWRGEPVEGVTGLDEWEARVQELHELRLQALDARIDSDLRLGRHRQTTAELQALVLEHPLHESFHKQLMLALYRGGRQTDALNAYQKLRHSLSHELGIDPSPAVQRVHEAILNADPQLDAVDAPSHKPVRQTTVAPIADSPPLDEAAYAISADHAARDTDWADIHATADALPGMRDRDAGNTPVSTGEMTVVARIVRVVVRIAFWIFLVAAALFTALAIGVCFDKDPADDVSIGVIVFIWLFDLGVFVLPTFLLGRRLRRYKNAVGTTAVRG